MDEQHISVSMSSSFGEEYKSLRCMSCGNIVCQYNNSFIRSITPSGQPFTERPGKIYMCSGRLFLQGQVEPYEILYQLLDDIFSMGDIDQLRVRVATLARDGEKNRVKCKARYFLS